LAKFTLQSINHDNQEAVMKATAKDLRFHSKELLDTVNRGEEVVITYRGKPCAKLVPIKHEVAKSSGKNELFGIWKDYDETKDVEGYVRNLRKGRF
jgi:prevent-host-death family protein